MAVMKFLTDPQLFYIKARKFRVIGILSFLLLIILITMIVIICLAILLFPKNNDVSGDIVDPPEINYGYACTYGYTYLSYEDARNFQIKVCAKTNSSTTYRIQGGGSVKCTNGVISISQNDPQILTQAICVNFSPISTTAFKIADIDGLCPDGYATATAEETRDLLDQQSCVDVYSEIVEDNNAVLRIEAQGTLKSNNYNCTIKEWDMSNIDFILCIQRSLQDLVVKDITEVQCTTSQSVYSVQEALNDRNGADEFCSSIPSDGSVRLTGGGAMYGESNDCMVLISDTSFINDYLCGPYPR